MDKAETEHRSTPSRRAFLKSTGSVAVGASLAGLAARAYAASDNTIKLALIGCGGRGSGAAANAFRTSGGPVKLVAMADLYEPRLTRSLTSLTKAFKDKVDVPPDRRFIGFDAYRKAIDCLHPGDVALLTGYTAWRPVQLDYAVQKGVNVFMEKPFAVDPPAVRRLIKAGEIADKKNLKIAAGLMCRHSQARQQLIQRIRDGKMGEIQLVRCQKDAEIIGEIPGPGTRLTSDGQGKGNPLRGPHYGATAVDQAPGDSFTEGSGHSVCVNDPANTFR